MVLAFVESKVTGWFQWFEKKAHKFEWPCNRSVGLIPNILKGKALKAYDWMGVDDLQDCDFKTTILKVYELRPEAYHLQYRGA